MATGKQSRIQCLDRALDIIEAIAARGDAGATELAQALGLNAATVHNILATLAARRYLLNDGGRYRVGPSLGALGGRWDPVPLLPQLARPHLEAITEATGESAVATVLAGEMAVMVATTPGRHEVTTQHPRETWPDPLVLATGRVLVAFEEEERRAPFVHRHALEKCRDEAQLPEAMAAVTEMLERARRDGVATLDAPPGGVHSIAAPVRAGQGRRVIAAVGATCPAFRATEEHRARMREAVLEAAEALSGQL